MNSARDANLPLRLALSHEALPLPKPPGIRRNPALDGRWYTNCCCFCQKPHRDKRDFMTCRASHT